MFSLLNKPFDRISIRLFTAFATVTAGTLLVATAAWFAFSQFSEQTEELNNKHLPMLIASTQFAEIGGQITATAPRLLTASSSWSQESTWAKLESQLQLLEASLLPLNKPLENLLPQIKANLHSLNENVSLRFDLNAKNREAAKALRWAHADFLDEITPILEDNTFNTQFTIQQLAKASSAHTSSIQQQLESHVENREHLMQINADCNLAVGLILQAASQQNSTDINHALIYLEDVTERLKININLLQKTSSNITLRQSVTQILNFSGGQENLITLKLRELVLQEHDIELLNESKDLIKQLKNIITLQVKFAESASKEAAFNATQTITKGKVWLIIMLVLSLLIAYLVSRYYVGKNILNRLHNIQEKMAAIASGDLETSINTHGNDEISKMAKALLVFKNTAIEVEQANAQTIIDNALVGLMSTNEQGIIESFNLNARDLFKIHDNESPVGQNFVHCFLKHNNTGTIDLQQISQKTNHPFIELQGLRSDGSHFPLDLHLSVYHRRQSRKFLLTLINASERVHAQQLLEQRISARTQDLQLANNNLIIEVQERKKTEAELRSTHQELIQSAKLANLGQLSAGIAHELNQPLSAVRFNSHNASKLIEKERFQEALNCMIKIENLSSKMAKIINHLKNFSRRADQTLQTINAIEAIDNALSLFSERIDRMKCTVLRDTPKELMIYADDIRLEQVFVNLIGNALDAMQASQSPCIQICSFTKNEQAYFSISDSGSGMSKDTLEQIFDPFFTTKEASDGLGLGLSISAKIVKEFGGKLTATSQANNGSNIQLHLKLAP